MGTWRFMWSTAGARGAGDEAAPKYLQHLPTGAFLPLPKRREAHPFGSLQMSTLGSLQIAP